MNDVNLGFLLSFNIKKHVGRREFQAAPAQVLFISGTRDPFMGDFTLLQRTLKKSKLRCNLVACKQPSQPEHALKLLNVIEAFLQGVGLHALCATLR